jgi:two-component system, OmpR family, sensor histidine kinase CiaH
VSSTTARLAASYLAVIMILSLAFSFVIYKESSHELGRQIPPTSLFSPAPDTGSGDGFGSYHHFFEQRIDEARSRLLGRLIFLNIGVLLGGAALSYYLARRTLQPIESAMEAQSRFVTDASHELRTPLTAILTSNEVALRKAGLTLPQAKKLIRSNTEEMSRLKLLSDSLLSLSKTDAALRLEPISLQDVASDAMNQILPAAQHKKITIDDTTAPIKVLGDTAALTQAATIILDNAIKYSPKKSTIYLTAQTENGFGTLEVRDEGLGIAATDLPHIFERFYRADPARTAETGGHGIGLSIAHKIVEQHKGRLTVTSATGQGSTFTLSIPLA